MSAEMTTPALDNLLEDAEQARVLAARKLEELAEAQRQADLLRRQRRLEAWQQWASTYDPAALRKDVDDTEAAVHEALVSCELGRALVDHLAALRRRAAFAALADDAAANGAVLAAPADLGSTQQIGEWTEFAGTLLSTLAAETANAMVDDQITAVRDSAKAAYASVDTRDPVAFRITSPIPADYVDAVGSGKVTFIAGVAYVNAADPVMRYYRSNSSHYEITPVFGIPSEYSAALAKREELLGTDRHLGVPTREA